MKEPQKHNRRINRLPYRRRIFLVAYIAQICIKYTSLNHHFSNTHRTEKNTEKERKSFLCALKRRGLSKRYFLQKGCKLYVLCAMIWEMVFLFSRSLTPSFFFIVSVDMSGRGCNSHFIHCFRLANKCSDFQFFTGKCCD